jgi:hypothetical protein
MTNPLIHAARLQASQGRASFDLGEYTNLVLGLIAVHLVALLAWIALTLTQEVKAARERKDIKAD